MSSLEAPTGILIHSFDANQISNQELQQLEQVLSLQELQHSETLKKQINKKCYIIAKAQIRLLLSEQVESKAAQLQFYNNKHGKPILKQDSNAAIINFNISHSGSQILIAISKQGYVGIDIEHLERKGKANYLNIAKRFFHPDELQFLQQCSEAQYKKVFFHIWTCKEAVVKALGYGIGFGLDKFCVQPNPKEEPSLLSIKHNKYNSQQLILQRLDIVDGYAAAVAHITNP